MHTRLIFLYFNRIYIFKLNFASYAILKKEEDNEKKIIKYKRIGLPKINYSPILEWCETYHSFKAFVHILFYILLY